MVAASKNTEVNEILGGFWAAIHSSFLRGPRSRRDGIRPTPRNGHGLSDFAVHPGLKECVLLLMASRDTCRGSGAVDW